MGYSPYNDMMESVMIRNTPQNWECRRLKFCASYNDESLPENTEPDTEMSYVDISSVNLVEEIRFVDELTFEKAPSRARRIVKDGDTIISTVRTYLKAIAAIKNPPRNMIVSTGFAVIRPGDEVNSSYLSYFLQSQTFVDTVMANSVGISYPAINALDLVCIPIVYPKNLEEQKQIATFLDHKTAQIDRLIEKKKALIEKLNEKRLALITRAVTKGLRPDAPMQPSGVDWLGDVPAHWAVRRLRFAIQSNPVKSEIDDLADDDLVSFVPMDAVGEYGGMRLEMEKPLDEVYNGYTYFRDNDVVIAKITPCFENGKGAIAEGLTNGVAFGTTELHVLRPLAGYSSRWLFYLSTCHAFREIGAAEMYGAGGQKRVPESFIKDFRIGIPDFDEQESIADFIDSEVQNLDAMLRLNDQTIERLAEYRTALITAAVTGKIDARNVESRK